MNTRRGNNCAIGGVWQNPAERGNFQRDLISKRQDVEPRIGLQVGKDLLNP